MRIALGDVRRVGYHEIKLFPANTRKPVGFEQTHVADVELQGIFFCNDESFGRNVHCRDPRQWTMFCYAERDSTAAGSQVKNLTGGIGSNMGQYKVYQQFGFRPGNEYLGRNEKRQAVEFAYPGKVGDRFAMSPPQGQFKKGLRLRRCEFLPGV